MVLPKNIKLFNAKRFKDGSCTYKNTGSSHSWTCPVMYGAIVFFSFFSIFQENSQECRPWKIVICLLSNNDSEQMNHAIKTRSKWMWQALAIGGKTPRREGSYLTIIPRARMGSESIAHEAEGRMGYWLRGHSGSRNNCFSKIQLVGQKYRDKTTLAS